MPSYIDEACCTAPDEPYPLNISDTPVTVGKVALIAVRNSWIHASRKLSDAANNRSNRPFIATCFSIVFFF